MHVKKCISTVTVCIFIFLTSDGTKTTCHMCSSVRTSSLWRIFSALLACPFYIKKKRLQSSHLQVGDGWRGWWKLNTSFVRYFHYRFQNGNVFSKPYSPALFISWWSGVRWGDGVAVTMSGCTSTLIWRAFASNPLACAHLLRAAVFQAQLLLHIQLVLAPPHVSFTCMP